jgi:hypothetical protein
MCTRYVPFSANSIFFCRGKFVLVTVASEKASAHLPSSLSRSAAAQNCLVMTNAAGTAPHPTPPTPLQQQQHQPPKDQQQKALALNAFRLKGIGDRIRFHLKGMSVPPVAELAHLIYAFARCASTPPLAIPSFLGSALPRAPPPSSPLVVRVYARRAVRLRRTHISCCAHAEGLTSRSQLVIFL